MLRLVVEGPDDFHFFQALFSKFKILISPGNIRISGGKPKLKKTVFSLINYKTQYILVAEDLDTRTPAELLNSWKNSLTAKFSTSNVYVLHENTFKIKKEDMESTLTIIPMGLPDDNLIRNLALSHFMMEDYVVKILSENSDEFFQSLKFKITSSSKLKEKISEILSLLRQQNIPVTSSKEVFALMRILLSDMPPYPFIKNIIQKTEETILKTALHKVIEIFNFVER